MKKLLATTSIMALAATPAFAQLALQPADDAGTAGDLTDEITVAEEIDFSVTGAQDTTLSLEVATVGTIPPGQNIFLTVNVTGGTFTTGLTGAEFFDGTTGATVNSGGAKGGASVRYLLTSNTGNDTPDNGGLDRVALTLPITYGGCGADLSFNVSEFATESGGTVIEGGSATLDNGLTAGDSTFYITCTDAFDASIIDDSTAGSAPGPNIDTLLDFAKDLDGFVIPGGDPDPDGAGPLGDEDEHDADLGLFLLAVDTTALIGVAAGSAAAAPANVTGCDVAVAFEDATNITDVTAIVAAPDTLFADGGPNAPVSDVSDIDCGAAAIGAAEDGALRVFIDTAAGKTVATQQPTCSGTIDLDTTVGLLATDPLTACGLDDLDPNSVNRGPFDWVGDATKGTRNVFRVSGLTTLPTIEAEVANSSAGLNGNCGALAHGDTLPEIIINANALTDACGNFGRGDITLKFFLDPADAPSLDVDRLMATGGDNIVSDFGNAGEDPDGNVDGDDD